VRVERSGYQLQKGSGAKPFAYDLALGRGVVPSRAVSLLRSTETQPFDFRFVLGGLSRSPLMACIVRHLGVRVSY
jgi:hypothetical protein